MVATADRSGAWRALYPFESHWLHLAPPGGSAARPSERMHYLDEGSGEPVLALHGNPSWSFYYRELVKGLRETHRVIVPDHVGCGLSDKPQEYPYTLKQHIDNVEALVDRLHLGPFNLVVHDWGGAIGMGLAGRRPDLVKRIAILNTGAFRSDWMPLGLSFVRLPVVGDLLVRGLNGFALGALATCVMHRSRLTHEVRSGYLAPYDSWAHRIATLRFVQDIPMAPTHPSWRTLLQVERGLPLLADRPKLIAWGARDWVFNDRFLDRWREIYPDAEVHRFADAGHYVMEDAHERILPLVRDLLARPA